MTYLTLLTFVVTINGEHFKTVIPFETEATCEKALRLSSDMYDILYNDWEDATMGCERTDVASGYTVRPKARPWKDGEK